MVGSTLNHYRLVKALGSGGMGDVYLADDTRLKRQVAIKILPAALAAQSDRRERFEREAQAIAALNHPNIVTIFSVEQSADTHFLTMEFVDGRTLADVLPKSGLPLTRLLAIARQIVDAVVAAHDQGIVHRDLKPANVMVTGNDRVKVLDFGLAKLREAADPAIAASMPTRELTGEGRIVGTVAYMSPEQAEGKTVDGRSDVFSIGVMLYELAAGARPFAGDTSLSVLTSILRDTPKEVTDLNAALPRDFARITRRCLAKDADRRYQSAKDLRNDLDELAQALDSGELNAPPSAGRARRRVWPMVAAACVAVAAIGLAAALRLRDPIVRLASAPPTATFTRLTIQEGAALEPCLSPDGKWVVYVNSTSGNPDIYLQSVTGQTAINLTKDSPAADRSPAFAPDGELVVFRSEREGGGLFIMGRTGESVRRLTRTGFQPAWFPDGKRIVFASVDVPAVDGRGGDISELWWVNASGGEPQRLFDGDATQPRVSPHGTRIAFWNLPTDSTPKRFAGTNRDIWTVATDGTRPVRVTSDDANDWNPVWAPDGRSLYFLSNRSGSMNLWRVAVDETTGATTGQPQALTVPSPYIRHFALSADGSVGTYATLAVTNNLARIHFDPRTATVDGTMEPITTGPRDFGTIDINPGGRELAVSTSTRQQEDLYVIPADGGALRQLTNDRARDRAVRSSPDGRRVLFYSDRSGTFEVWSIDRDGSGLRQLTTSPGRYYPVPSRDGSKVTASDINSWQLYVYDSRDFSKPLETLPPFPQKIREGGQLAPLDWSPDGRQLAGTAARRLWVYAFDTKTYRTITDVTGESGTWLPDSRRIIIGRQGRFFVTDTSSGESRQLYAIPGEQLGAARLTIDGAYLYFTHGTTSGDIWLVRFGEK
jgi:Tol biopolymer transport system component/predicted Ser/Thr protein kinase